MTRRLLAIAMIGGALLCCGYYLYHRLAFMEVIAGVIPKVLGS